MVGIELVTAEGLREAERSPHPTGVVRAEGGLKH